MPARLNLRHLLFATGVLLPLVYQNCAQAPSDEGEMSASSSYISSLPFAYKVQMDTIGYMSCSNIAASVNPRTYFTFRVGAYNPISGGLSITNEFVEATQYYTPTDRGRVLAQSERNSATLMSLSIRQAGHLQSVWSLSDSTVIPGQEIDAFLPALDSDEIAGPLSASPIGTKLNYFPGESEKRLIEATLQLVKNEDDSKKLRDDLGGTDSFLTVGFSETPDESDTMLRGPSSFAGEAGAGQPSNSAVYGVGYRVGFGLGKGMTDGDRRVLAVSGVTETNLETGTTDAMSWNCSQNFQFLIIRPEDIAAEKAACNTTVDIAATKTQQDALRAIRRVLRVEDWYVDVVNHCVVPKNTGDYCYGNKLGTRAIQYYDAQCSNTIGSGTVTGTACPHFVSVCVRK